MSLILEPQEKLNQRIMKLKTELGLPEGVEPGSLGTELLEIHSI